MKTILFITTCLLLAAEVSMLGIKIGASESDLKNLKLEEEQYNDITKDLLGYKTGEHIIFYFAIGKNEIEVVRILHGMMDLKRQF